MPSRRRNPLNAPKLAADVEFMEAKIITARFYSDHVLSQAPGLAYAVVNGAIAPDAEASGACA